VPIEFFEDDSISLKKKMQKVLENSYLKTLGFNDSQCQWLQNHYEKNVFKPHWINDSMVIESGIKMKTTLANSLWFGIPENRIIFSKKKNLNWVEEEVILTAKTALILFDLNKGFLNLKEKKYNLKYFISSEALDSALALSKKQTYDEIFLQQRITDTNYQFMSSKLYSFCQTYPLDKSTFDVEAFKDDSIYTIPKATKALISKGYLDENSKDSLKFVEAIKVFQEHNGLKKDGKVGKYTAWALNESTYDKVLRTAFVMDKLRTSMVYPSKCIRINLPEYLLRFFVNDSLKQIHNIIIGKTENQTPQLESKIRNIVVYPYWKVPYSIASKEVLPAAKRSAAYFAKNNYKLYKGKTEINPYAVNWKRIKDETFPYQIIQEPGPKNSLGIIKFEFYNDYSVYVHDSPAKSLFKTDIRSYSHGCMRCENPVDLGKVILDYDSVGRKRNDLTRDSLDTLLSRAENFVIHLKKPVPIYVEYNTVFADREKLIFHLDIYKRDEEYLKIMKE
jgi:peptidoglycan hydrolase-like protein with peptidoglycan-binding domain